MAQLKVGGLQIASPDERVQIAALDIGTASIDLNLGALFSKTLLIDHLEVDSSSLSLQVLADGRTNWNSEAPTPPRQTIERAGPLLSGWPKINDVKLSFLGKNPRFNQQWDIHKLRSSLPEGRNESAFVLRGLYNGTPLSIDGSLTLLGDDDLSGLTRGLGCFFRYRKRPGKRRYGWWRRKSRNPVRDVKFKRDRNDLYTWRD